MASESLDWFFLWLVVALVAVPVGVGTFTLTVYYTGATQPIAAIAWAFSVTGLVSGMIGMLLHDAGFGQ